jgi:hypothetical protein
LCYRTCIQQYGDKFEICRDGDPDCELGPWVPIVQTDATDLAAAKECATKAFK